jgi:sugar phosphate isomerase/epimerase
MKAQIGLIPGIIRDDIEQDAAAAYKQVAQLGYKGVEGGASTLEGDTPKMLADLGLKIITVGVKPLHDDQAELEKTIAAAVDHDVDHISTWWGPANSKEEILADAEKYNAFGKKVADAGMKFTYHNHDHEFKTTFDGKRTIDLLLDNTDPACVYFEPDVAWVTYGGVDPVEFLTTHKDRVPVIHLKDVIDLSERGKFCAVGAGYVAIEGVLGVCEQVGIPWAVIEQDRPNNLTGMESVAASIYNLREKGWA